MPEKALILTPYFGGIDSQHLECKQELVRRGWEERGVRDCALVDHARAALAGIAMADVKYDMVLWVDHDILFQPHEAEELVKTARELNAMVGAAVIMKKPRGQIMVVGLEPGIDLVFGPNGVPLPCKALPFGFTAMPKALLRRVCEHVGPSTKNGVTVYPAFHCRPWPGTNDYTSEDYSFCMLVAEVGGKMYLDTRRRVGHKGNYVYCIEDAVWAVPETRELRITVAKPGNANEYAEPELALFDGPETQSEIVQE